jgi:preprotein translocase subunit SecG
MTYTFFLVLIIIVAALLILVIMVQNPKGGGLSSSFGGGGTQAMGGVQNTTNFLDKSTWYLFAILLGLILLSNFAIIKKGSNANSQVQQKLEDTQLPVQEDKKLADPISTTPAKTTPVKKDNK